LTLKNESSQEKGNDGRKEDNEQGFADIDDGQAISTSLGISKRNQQYEDKSK
jgi:hypothetical protein